jgi:hypothetical protein
LRESRVSDGRAFDGADRDATRYSKIGNAYQPRSAPCFGLQFFGHVDGETEVMTVTLKDMNDRALVEGDRAEMLQRVLRDLSLAARTF